MRTIKFRAWDGRCMLYFDLQDIEASDSLSHGKEFQLNDTLMQFTGLHDKNGKEIYEGDIVSVDDGKRLCKVVWFKPQACFDTVPVKIPDKLTLFRNLQNADWHSRCEVIGNIYENIDLAGGTQKGQDLGGTH